MKKVPSLGDGELVEFDVIIGEKGMSEASNVFGPKGAAVKGSLCAWNRRGCGDEERGGKGRSKNRNEMDDGEGDGSEKDRGRGRRQMRRYARRGGI